MTDPTGCIDDEPLLIFRAWNTQAIGQLSQTDFGKCTDIQSFHGIFFGQQMKGRMIVWV